MEQAVVFEKSTLRELKQPEDISPVNPLWAQSDLVTEDPATFLVANHILVSGTDSVSDIKKYFKRVPEVLEVLDDVLAQMEKSELISVDGDRLQVKERFIDIGGNLENLRRFLPRLFMIASDRVLGDAITGAHRPKRDGIRYWAVPNDQKSSIEAQAIYLEFKTKMNGFMAKVKAEGRLGESVRLIAAVNCSLLPEDFV